MTARAQHPSVEVPFPQPMPATLLVDPADNDVAWLTFIDPKHLRRTSLPVSSVGTFDHPEIGPVWGINLPADGGDRAVTVPSTWVPGDWHSPNPTSWLLVPNDQLEVEARKIGLDVP